MNEQIDPNQRFQGPQGTTVVLAGFWVRFLATMVDGMIVSVITVPLAVIIGLINTSTGKQFEVALTVVNYLVSAIGAGFYHGYFYSKKGATPGKSLLGLQIVNVETGTYPDFWAGFWRDSVGKFLSAISLGIGYFMVVFRKDKRAMHDLIANTQVIRLPGK